MQTPNAQMDMVIIRADKVTTLCEMKYTNNPYAITKQEADKLRRRPQSFANGLKPTMRQRKHVGWA